MSPHLQNKHIGHGDHYMDTTIQTASPARLRLMLIERGIEVAENLSHAWRNVSAEPASDDSALKLLEILNELLSGVTGTEYDVCRKVADLYVFLLKHLVAAEETRDADSIDEIAAVLRIEAETWRLVCAAEAADRTGPSSQHAVTESGGLNLQV
jgi:flagellar protein FliS